MYITVAQQYFDHIFWMRGWLFKKNKKNKKKLGSSQNDT